MKHYVFFVFALLSLFSTLLGDRIEALSFESPFNIVDNLGNRIVSAQWRAGGTAVTNQNFIRLTPDRQNKKGGIWSRKALGVDSFSAILKFRISGQGKSLFGDGLALWITHQGFFIEGNLHGNVEKYTGVGIVFDTFRNTETIGQHRDVAILVNDGTKSIDDIVSNVQGCNANVRYHSERADFSVTDQSKAKVIVTDLNLQVFIDARDEGEWTECLSMTLPFQSGWSKRAHIGMTASTGQLADNHDVLSFLLFSDLAKMDLADQEEKDGVTLFESDPTMPVEDRLLSCEEGINDMMVEYHKLQYKFEMELVTLKDNNKVVLEKLNSREDKSEGRIEDLETRVTSSISGSIEDRLRRVESSMKGHVTRSISKSESDLESKFKVNFEEGLAGASRGWMMPFLVLVLFMLAGIVAIYIWYNNLKKRHIL